MNTKIILGLGTTVLLTSSLLACSPQSNMKERKNSSSCKQNKMQKHHKGEHGGPRMVKMFMHLDLDDAQRTKIRAIVKESMKNIPNPHMAFSDTSFNKDEFVKLAKQRREYKVTHRAQMIEKIYATLSKLQKKDFKTMLDMKEMMKRR